MIQLVNIETALNSYLSRSASRRGFIRDVSHGTAYGVVGRFFQSPHRNEYSDSQLFVASSAQRTELPSGLPEDTLHPEELTQANITIFHTPTVELYLARNIFEIPLYQEARVGKLSLQIPLVNAENLSPPSFLTVPEEALGLYRLNYEIRHFLQQFYLEVARTQPDQQNQALSSYSNLIHKPTIATGWFMSGRRFNEEIPELRQQGVRIPDSIFNGRQHLKSMSAIYAAVGGRLTPNPTQSYPSPWQFRNQNLPFTPELIHSTDGYLTNTDSLTAIYVMHHESHHHEHEEESGADYEALKDLLEKRNPFIFRTLKSDGTWDTIIGKSHPALPRLLAA